MADIQQVVTDAMEATVGRNPGDAPLEGGLSIFNWLVNAGDIVPPWWSKARDRKLVEFAIQSNHLSIAIYNAVSRMVGIPFEIEARDPSISLHVDQATEITDILRTSAGFGKGWQVEYSKFILDLLTTDNGAFMEVIGDGDPDGPIVGRPISLRHLDSHRCTRTGNPIYPVLYADDDGRVYKMHWTRIVFTSQLPSAKAEMHEVGLCAVSRSVMIAQNLTDISVYKQELLGSRPQNQIILGQGITGAEIMAALRRHNEELNNLGHTRYARSVAIGSKNTAIDLKKIDLTSMAPFNEEVSTNLGMFAIAAAFGMDADELWPVGGGAGSKGDADLKRARSRGRLPAQLTAEVQAQFNFKVMPPHLRFVFDFQDDAEDQNRAVIQDIRARNMERMLNTGAITIRQARMKLMVEKDISRDMYENMEVDDGRLADGTSIAVLFFTPDPVYDRHLRFSNNPLAIAENIEADEGKGIIKEIQANRADVLAELGTTSSRVKERRLNLAFHALDWLEDQYRMATGSALPPVAFGHRRLRTDIRVQEPGSTRAAGETQVIDENVPEGGGG